MLRKDGVLTTESRFYATGSVAQTN